MNLRRSAQKRGSRRSREHALLDYRRERQHAAAVRVKRLLDAVLVKLVLRGEALTSVSWRSRSIASKAACSRSIAPGGADVGLGAAARLGALAARDAAAAERERSRSSSRPRASPTTAEQLRVFAEQPRRDLAAADRALARLRAELGEESVVRAVLCDGHLPEACFAWQPIAAVRAARRRCHARAGKSHDTRSQHARR